MGVELVEYFDWWEAAETRMITGGLHICGENAEIGVPESIKTILARYWGSTLMHGTWE